MFDWASSLLLAIAALGAGLMAGVYFAFSGFIMKSLDQLDAEQAIAAMNRINEAILRSWFMPLFFGSSLVFLMLVILALLGWDDPGAPLQLAGGLTYLAGMFLCTALLNVPLNNRLARVEENDVDISEHWSYYYRHWTRWNHVRTVASTIACAMSIYLLTE